MGNLKQAFEYASQNPDSDFANNLRELAKSGALDQEAKKFGIDLSPFKPVPEKPSQLSRLGTDLKSRVSNVGQQFKQIGEAEGVVETAAQIGQTPLRVVGQAAGAVGDVIGAGVNAATFGGLDKLGEYISSTETGQKLGSALAQFAQEQPELAAGLGDIINIATVGAGGAAAKPVAKGVQRATTQGLQRAGTVAREAGENIAETASVLRPIAEDIIDIPRRSMVNLADRKATAEIIQSLPSKAARTAARDGVAIADINVLSQLSKADKEIYKPLIEEVKKFSSGLSRTDPIEKVGKPLVAQLKKADAERKVIGKQLGEISKDLGTVAKPDLENAVITRLSSTPGLEGIRVVDGTLDFTDTNLSSALSSADQNAIQEAFKKATSINTGRQAHLFRQELFEILGGKQRSLSAMTDTQEKAFESIRKALSDVLEPKNPQYKELSAQYAKLTEPLKELRKLNKSLDPNASEDVLDLSAGLLARRLTSNAPSNPRVREALKMLDEATLEKGMASVNTENLIDLYNVLDRYYNITSATSLKGQVQSATNPVDALTGAVKEVAGRTPAVQQKAIEDLLEELLK